MRTPVYGLLLASLICGPAFAQTAPQLPAQPTTIRIRCAPPATDSAKPLVVIDTFVTQLEYLVLEAANIESINVLKNTEAITKWGERGKGGAIVITPARTAKLLTLQELFEYYNVPAADRMLKVSIDGKPVAHPELILVDPKAVSSVGTYSASPLCRAARRPEDFQYCPAQRAHEDGVTTRQLL